MDVLHATEVSFTLGPGTLEDARAIAARLGAEASRSRDEMLFVDAEAGIYGYLALWDERTDAIAFGANAAVLDEIEALERRVAKPPAVRHYTVERPGGAR